MARGFRMGVGGGGTSLKDFNLIPDLAISSWTQGSTGYYSAPSLTFNDNNITAWVQLNASSGNSYYWKSAAISTSKYTKLIVSNTVTRGGSNPGGFTGNIDIYVNGTLLTTISGDHTEYVVALPSNLSDISIQIRTTMEGSGGTWPWCQNLISKLTLTK